MRKIKDIKFVNIGILYPILTGQVKGNFPILTYDNEKIMVPCKLTRHIFEEK